jgi:predicted nucleic acid-binding protein
MIVVDANILAYCWIPGANTPLAKAVLKNDPEWRVPPLWRSECLSILAGYMRSERLTFDQSLGVIKGLERWLRAKEHRPNAEMVLKLIRESRCSAYDCEYMAVAKELGVPLVTEDRLLLETFPHLAVPMHAFIGR